MKEVRMYAQKFIDRGKVYNYIILIWMLFMYE